MCRSSGFTSPWTNPWNPESSLEENETLTAPLLTWRKKKMKASRWLADLPREGVRVSPFMSLFRLWVLRWTHWSGFHSCRSLCSSINPLRDFHPHGWASVRLKIVLLTDGRRRACCEHKLSFSPGVGGKVQFTCSYSLYPAVFTHLRSCCKAWLALRLNGNPPRIHLHPTMQM